jgi:hypothetical protein
LKGLSEAKVHPRGQGAQHAKVMRIAECARPSAVGVLRLDSLAAVLL